MPCDSSQGMGDAYRADPIARLQMQAMKKDLDTVTRMLCFVLHAMQHGATGLPADIAEWYRKHQEWDKSQGR